MKSFYVSLLCLILLVPATVSAELPDQVEREFATITGTVIMPLGDEFVVDLDDRDSLFVGDILALFKPGQEAPLGFLQVTRIQSSYSYVKPLSAELKPKPGAEVRRFDQVPAYFAVSKGEDAGLVKQMQAELPQFRWLNDAEQGQALLTFAVQDATLEVKTADDSLLHSYKLADDQKLVSPPVPVRRPFVSAAPGPEPKMLQRLANTLLEMSNLADPDYMGGRDISMINQNTKDQRGVWVGMHMVGDPVGIAVADLDGDGQQEIAFALRNKLVIARIAAGKLKKLAEVEMPRRLQAFSLDAFDLDQNGRPELYLTAVGGFMPASMVVEYTGDDYAVVIDDIRWFLRKVEVPGRGLSLVGQQMGSDEETFVGKPFIVKRDGARLVAAEKFSLPKQSNIYSFAPFVDEQGQSYTIFLTDKDKLKVNSAAGRDLWVSKEYFGGSESCVANREGHMGDTVVPECLRSRIIKTANNELLVVQNSGQRILQRFREYSQNRLVSFSWKEGTLVENWRTANQKGYLADFATGDADNDGSIELVMGVKFQYEGFVDKPKSVIAVFDME